MTSAQKNSPFSGNEIDGVKAIVNSMYFSRRFVEVRCGQETADKWAFETQALLYQAVREAMTPDTFQAKLSTLLADVIIGDVTTPNPAPIDLEDPNSQLHADYFSFIGANEGTTFTMDKLYDDCLEYMVALHPAIIDMKGTLAKLVALDVHHGCLEEVKPGIYKDVQLTQTGEEQ